MNGKILTVVLAGTIFTTAFLPALSIAGNGRVGGKGLRTQIKSVLKTHDRSRLHDGSCLTIDGAFQSGKMNKKGNTYGPGDGTTGNDGVGPKDGTGFGAPENR